MSLISNLSKTAKIMIVSVIAVCLVLLIVGLVLLNLIEYYNIFDNFELEKSLPYAMGLTLGGVSSIIKIILIERSLNRAIEIEDEKRAAHMGRIFYIGRFVLSFAVLLIGAIVHFFGFFGTIFGIFSLQAAAYITNVIELKNAKNMKNIEDIEDMDSIDNNIETNTKNESKER